MDRKCRTCSRDDQFEGISVNAYSESHQEPIYLMLIYCTQLQYSFNDTFPQQICPECLVLLDGAFTFWKQCRQMDANFRSGELSTYDWGEIQPIEPVVEPETTTYSNEKCPEMATNLVELVEHPKQEHSRKRRKLLRTAKPCRTLGQEDSLVSAEAEAASTSSTSQRFWCCFRMCTVVTTNLADLEQHAKRQHFGARVAYEIQQPPNCEYVCSVCCAGFKSLGSYEYHRTIQIGTRQKGATSAKAKKRQQQLKEEEEKLKHELRAVDTTVVKEELEMDDWPEDMEDAAMEIQDESMDETSEILVCVQTSDSNAIRCHQRQFGHDGIDRSRSETTSKPNVADETNASSSTIQFEIVPVKDEPYLSEEEESSQDALEDGQEKFDCTLCGEEFNSDLDKQRHMMCDCSIVHTKDVRYTCEHCKVTTTHTVKELKRHMQTNCPALQGAPSNAKKITRKQCSTCQRNFKTSEGLERHKPFCTKGNESQKFTCPNCNMNLRAKFNLARHLKLRACLKDPHQCKNCFIKFSDLNTLKRHRKVGCTAIQNEASSGTKKSCICDGCAKGFATKPLLRLHKIVDACGESLAEKPAEGKSQCPYCYIQLSRPINLKRHLQKYCLVLQHKQAEVERKEAAETNVS